MLKKLFRVVILPYTLGMLYLMFIRGRSQYEYNEIRITPILSTYQFLEDTTSLFDASLVVMANFIMFVPFGFLGWVWPSLKNPKLLINYFLCTIIILETLQYFTRLGVFDIDDVILNTLGVYFGYHFCKFLEKRFTRLVL